MFMPLKSAVVIAQRGRNLPTLVTWEQRVLHPMISNRPPIHLNPLPTHLQPIPDSLANNKHQHQEPPLQPGREGKAKDT